MSLTTSILAPMALVAVALTALGSTGGHGSISRNALASVETVTVQPGAFTYRLPGEYLASNRPIDAPLEDVRFHSGLEFMKYQVSAADYARCVADTKCKAADGDQRQDNLPVTGIDWKDAVDYADWLSDKTGTLWRLPTDVEWAFAAGDRLNDEALGFGNTDTNPSDRWLARYRNEASDEASDPQPQPLGHFGTNSNGLADIAGNVWDWTSACYVRTTMDDHAHATKSIENCGVRIAGGKHRAYMSFFIRDGKSGGCAAGMAPNNLGIRLVHEQPSYLARLKAFLRAAGQSLVRAS